MANKFNFIRGWNQYAIVPIVNNFQPVKGCSRSTYYTIGFWYYINCSYINFFVDHKTRFDDHKFSIDYIIGVQQQMGNKDQSHKVNLQGRPYWWWNHRNSTSNNYYQNYEYKTVADFWWIFLHFSFDRLGIDSVWANKPTSWYREIAAMLFTCWYLKTNLQLYYTNLFFYIFEV